MLKKFEKVELGMTREDVEKIMGEPDATYGTAPSGNVFDMVEYGYLDSAFWYYRDAKYDDQKDELLALEPWTQIRFTFDKTGALIEAYYNAAYDSGLWNDYGTGEKEILGMEFVGDAPIIERGGIPSELKPYARIAFKDGSYYRGEIVFKSNAQKINGSDPAQGIVKYEHPWGEDEAILMWE